MPAAEDYDRLNSKLAAGVDREYLATLSDTDLSGGDFSGRDLRGADLRGADLSSANLNSALLSGADLSGADLSGANLQDADLQGAKLEKAKLAKTNLEGANLQDANLEGAKLYRVDLEDANLEGANLRGANLQKANLQKANLHAANLHAANLGGANLQDTRLSLSNLQGAKLQGAKLQGADLQDANLLDVSTDASTSFLNADLGHARIRAHTVVDIEGITERQRMRLDIRDSLAQLRRDYSGFWLWFHLAALAVFLSPYLVFVARAIISTAITSDVPDTAPSLAAELGWYILSAGGSSHDFSWWSVMFVFGILYNTLRGALLYKTHTLHLQHQITGLPLTYVLEHDRWWYLPYRLAKLLFWVNIGVAAWHGALLLSEPVLLHPIL